MQKTSRQLQTLWRLRSALNNNNEMPSRQHVCLHLLQHKKHNTTEASPGIMGSMRQAYDTAKDSREEKSKKKIFLTQMKYLSSTDPITPTVYLNLLEDVKSDSGVGGIKQHLPWVSNSEALKDLEQQEAVIKALTPAERQSTDDAVISVKKRISRATGADLITVDTLLSQISSMRKVQKHMHGRIKRGEGLPKDSEQLHVMMSTRGGSTQTMGMPKPGVKPGKQRR